MKKTQQPPSNLMNSGSILGEAQVLKSENGKYFLTLEYNGNVVVYKGRPFARPNSLWSSQTYRARNPHPYRLSLDLNGDLVLYDAKNARVWSSNTGNNVGVKGYTLKIENDGSLIIKDANDDIIWQPIKSNQTEI